MTFRGFLIELNIYSVGVAGFEPTTSCSQSRRDTGLRYTPNWYLILLVIIKLPFQAICVGVAGFEPTTSCSQSRRDTGLRYTPNWYLLF